MSNITVAVCIPTFNQAAYLASAVESAYAQTYPNVEIWVSDDHSTDTTDAVVRELLKKYSYLRYYRQERNLGISANNNWLLSQPSTDFIVRLDSDDLIHPSYVENLVSLMVKHPTAGYAHCAVQEIDEAGAARRVRRLGGRDEYQQPEQALRGAASGYRVAANICMFRTGLLRDLNYYRSGMNFCEDWDLSIRIADADWGNVYSSQVLSSYRVWQDAAQVRPKRKQVEVAQTIQVFEQSLEPAYRRRGWPTDYLNSRRRSLALNHGIVLDSSCFTMEERTHLTELLNSLGSSPALRVQSAMLRSGFGPLLRRKRDLQLMLKDHAKSFLGGIRVR